MNENREDVVRAALIVEHWCTHQSTDICKCPFYEPHTATKCRMTEFIPKLWNLEEHLRTRGVNKKEEDKNMIEVDTEAMLMEYPQDQEENEYRFIDAEWLDRVAAGLTAGAKKHPGETWKSIPAEEHAARAIRHLNMYRKGDRSEDHLINASMRVMMASVLDEERAKELSKLLEG